jgi:hypothetical protein
MREELRGTSARSRACRPSVRRQRDIGATVKVLEQNRYAVTMEGDMFTEEQRGALRIAEFDIDNPQVQMAWHSFAGLSDKDRTLTLLLLAELVRVQPEAPLA